MAKRLTDKQKKLIVADWVEMQSYSAVGRKHGVADNTVKRIVAGNRDIAAKVEQKKAENTADVLEYMEKQRGIVCEIIGKGLAVLNDPDKLAAATPSQITTALGTLIDKWTMMNKAQESGEGGVVLMPEVKGDE